MKHPFGSILSVAVVFCFLFANSGLADIADGLIVYYPFNGNAEDASGNALHGTLTGGGYSTDRFDNDNQALSGTVEIPDDELLDITDAFTLSAWFKIEAIYSAFNCLIGKDYSTAFAMESLQVGPEIVLQRLMWSVPCGFMSVIPA
jgi:hypothetical protein